MKKDEEERYGVIYKITNKINNKVYIGQTTKKNGFNGRYEGSGVGIERVWNTYKNCLKRNERKKCNSHLINSIKKYGLDAFEVIEEFDIAYSQEELNQKEIYWIKKYNSTNYNKGYNILSGGEIRRSEYENKVSAFLTYISLAKNINNIIDYVVDNNIEITIKKDKEHVIEYVKKISNYIKNEKRIKQCKYCGKYFITKGDICEKCVEVVKNKYFLSEDKKIVKAIKEIIKHKETILDKNGNKRYYENIINKLEKMDISKEGVTFTNYDVKIVKSFKEEEEGRLIFALLVLYKINKENKTKIKELKEIISTSKSTEALKQLVSKSKYFILNNDEFTILKSQDNKDVFTIYTLKKLTLQYKYHFKYDKSLYGFCQRCKLPYKKSKGTKYCNTCAKERQRESDRKYREKLIKNKI